MYSSKIEDYSLLTAPSNWLWLTSQEIKSIIFPLTQEGSIKTCSFDNPRSVIIVSWSVYIGQNGAIRRLPLKAIIDAVRPAEPIG